MAKIPFGFGVGGGDSSDDCTATASDILESKTAIYNGSDDDAAAGSMKDYSGTSTSVSAALNSSSSRVQMTIPNTGKYDTSSVLYTPYSSMASLIGLTAAKLTYGTSILGITGTSRVYNYIDSNMAVSTSVSTERWYVDSSTYHSMRHVELSNIGFTPRYAIFWIGYLAVWCNTSGCNEIDQSYAGWYSASLNSNYSFTQSSIYVPLHYTASDTCYYVVIGYNS